MKKWIVFFLIQLFSSAIAQEQSLLESAFDDSENYNPEQWTDDMEYFKIHPININTASEQELSKFHFLNDFQIKSLIDYRKTNGGFVSVYELKLLYGWDDAVITLILPYVVVKENLLTNKRKDHRFFTRASINNKKTNPSYQGNEIKFLSKYYFDVANHVHAGITLEKDAGEETFKGSNKTFDFVSGSVILNNIGHLKALAVGDYHSCFGQGLLLWTGFGLGKTPYGSGIFKIETGFTRYSSTDENRMMRGIATTVTTGCFDFSIFYSRKKADARFSLIDSSQTPMEFSSLQTSGLHRTASEIKNEKSLLIQQGGTNLSFRRERFKTGLTLMKTAFGATMNPENTLYNTHHFRGDDFTSISLDYRLILSKTEWFGELATMMNKNFATVHGVLVNFSSSLSGSFLYRYYTPGYFTLYSRSFGENNDASNEQGMFWALQFLPCEGLTINAYSDIFKFPWLKYTASQPTSGTDKSLETVYKINENLIISARVKYKLNEENSSGDSSVLNNTVRQRRQTIRLQLSYKATDQIELRNRLEVCRYFKNIKENGYFIYQDVIWRLPKRLTLWTRYGVFQTDGFNSRIYAYENDMTYAFSMPAYYGAGSMMYIMLKYHPFKRSEIGIRYHMAFYEDELHEQDKVSGVSIQSLFNF